MATSTRRADSKDKEDEDVTMSPFIRVRMWRKKKNINWHGVVGVIF